MSNDQDEPAPAPQAQGAVEDGRETLAQPSETTAPTVSDGPETFEGERIAKAIARAGVASRRDAEAMIEAGRVTLNGKPILSPAQNVTDSDRITVDGEPLPTRERTRLWLLHKPRGVVTTARDPQGRQTVFEILPDELPRVVAIGRLDINTEGLLLLTNDGGLAKVIAHPETGWLRRYRVRAYGDITQADLDKLRRGVTIDGMEYGPVEATLDRAQGDNVWITLGLREGKNREVKRILEHLGLSVNRLIRVSFGPFQLGDLEMGLVEEIRTKVLKEQLGKTLSEQAGVDFTSPVREPIAPFGKPPKAPAAAQSKTPGRAARPPRAAATRPRSASTRTGEATRSVRDPARPGRAASNAGTAGIRRSTWQAEDVGRQGGGPRIPRRGGDPKAARATSAERGRERVGAIRTGDRRVLVERLQPSPAPEPERREGRPARPPRRDGEAPMRRERGPERVGAERPNRERGADRRAQRPPAGSRPTGADRRPGGFERADNNRSGGGQRPQREGDAPRGARNDGTRGDAKGAFRQARPPARDGAGNREGFDKRPGGFGGSKRPGGGNKPGGRPGGGAPGGRPSADRPGADRPGRGRPGGGRPSGGRPGGGKPGGARPPRSNG